MTEQLITYTLLSTLVILIVLCLAFFIVDVRKYRARSAIEQEQHRAIMARYYAQMRDARYHVATCDRNQRMPWGRKR